MIRIFLLNSFHINPSPPYKLTGDVTGADILNSLFDQDNLNEEKKNLLYLISCSFNKIMIKYNKQNPLQLSIQLED